MTTKQIPFGNAQESGFDPLSGASPVAYNVVVDGKGAVHKRPGIVPLGGAGHILPEGVGGVYRTADGREWAVGTSAASKGVYLLGGVAPQRLRGASESYAGVAGDRRPTFAETQALLVIAAGGSAPQKVVLSSGLCAPLGGSPPDSTHLIANASRLLGNSVTYSDVVRFSGTAQGTTSYAGHEDWTPGIGEAGYVVAESRPDPVLAVAENTNEVYVFGKSTLEVYAKDGSILTVAGGSAINAYANSSTREHGCSAPYSIIKIDHKFFWLDDKRRFVASDGRTVTVISDGIKATLDLIDDVSDCYGFRVFSGNADCAVWVFPKDGRTFVYQDGVGWGQWGAWNPVTSTWGPLAISCGTMSGGDTLVGTAAGKVGKFQTEALDDFGTPIQASVITGYIDRDSPFRKHCQGIAVSMRRGGALSSGAVARIYYRDQPGEWSSPLVVDVGSGADTHIVRQFRGLGSYRRRQWRLDFSTREELVLLGVAESFTTGEF